MINTTAFRTMDKESQRVLLYCIIKESKIDPSNAVVASLLGSAMYELYIYRALKIADYNIYSMEERPMEAIVAKKKGTEVQIKAGKIEAYMYRTTMPFNIYSYDTINGIAESVHLLELTLIKDNKGPIVIMTNNIPVRYSDESKLLLQEVAKRHNIDRQKFYNTSDYNNKLIMMATLDVYKKYNYAISKFIPYEYKMNGTKGKYMCGVAAIVEKDEHELSDDYYAKFYEYKIRSCRNILRDDYFNIEWNKLRKQNNSECLAKLEEEAIQCQQH